MGRIEIIVQHATFSRPFLTPRSASLGRLDPLHLRASALRLFSPEKTFSTVSNSLNISTFLFFSILQVNYPQLSPLCAPPHPIAEMGFDQIITQIIASTKYLVHPQALVSFRLYPKEDYIELFL